MSVKKKILLFSIILFVVVTGITVGVLAALIQSATFNASFTFTAKTINCDVAIYGETEIGAIQFPANSNALGFADGAFNAGGSSTSAISFSLNNASRTATIPDLYFDGDGDKIPG